MNNFLKLTPKKFTLTTIFSVVDIVIVYLYAIGHSGQGYSVPAMLELIAPGLLLSPSSLGGAWEVFVVVTSVIYWYLIVCLIIWLWNKRKAN